MQLHAFEEKTHEDPILFQKSGGIKDGLTGGDGEIGFGEGVISGARRRRRRRNRARSRFFNKIDYDDEDDDDEKAAAAS